MSSLIVQAAGVSVRCVRAGDIHITCCTHCRQLYAIAISRHCLRLFAEKHARPCHDPGLVFFFRRLSTLAPLAA